MKKLLLLFIFITATNSFGYNEQDIDLSNHSNQHGVIFQALDKKEYYKNITYSTIRESKCLGADYKTIKRTSPIFFLCFFFLFFEQIRTLINNTISIISKTPITI